LGKKKVPVNPRYGGGEVLREPCGPVATAARVTSTEFVDREAAMVMELAPR
jgi:hypothetical protein